MEGEELFIWADKTRGSGFKLKEGAFTLDSRNKFFTQRMGRHRKMLPSLGCLIPGRVQELVGWDPEQPDL